MYWSCTRRVAMFAIVAVEITWETAVAIIKIKIFEIITLLNLLKVKLKSKINAKKSSAVLSVFFISWYLRSNFRDLNLNIIRYYQIIRCSDHIETRSLIGLKSKPTRDGTRRLARLVALGSGACGSMAWFRGFAFQRKFKSPFPAPSISYWELQEVTTYIAAKELGENEKRRPS